MMKKTKLMRKALVLTSLLAGVGLACEAVTYLELNHNADAAEFNSEVTSHMVTAVRTESLLRQINEGKLADAKLLLSQTLQFETALLKSRETGMDGNTRDSYNSQLAHMRAQAREHPEAFEATCRTAILGAPTTMQVAQH